MTYEPLSHSVLDSNTIMEQKNEIKLEFYQLLFLLQELYQKVSTQFSFFAAKKKTRDKQVWLLYACTYTTVDETVSSKVAVVVASRSGLLFT